MPLTYKPAPTVKAVAEKLIAGPHDRLAEEDVRYWFRSEKRRSAGRDIWGDAKKIVGLAAAMIRDAEGGVDPLGHEDADELLSAPMFVLVVPEDIWLILEETTREALIFDLLCRCRIEGSEEGARLTMVGPDLVEFVETVEAYGLWRDSVRRVAAGMFKSHPTLFNPDEVGLLVERDPDPATLTRVPGITLMPEGGEWVARCAECGEIARSDVRLEAQAQGDEHLTNHARQIALAAQAADEGVEDEGEEGAFGAAFDAKLDDLADDQADRQLHSVAP